MKIQERLVQLRKQREDKVKAMEGIFAKANEEGRAFDETEQKSFDDHKTDIAAIDVQIKNCETMEGMLDKTVVNLGTGTRVDLPNGRITTQRNLPKAAAFVRYAMSLAAGRGNTMMAAEVAKNLWSRETPEVEQILRAAIAAGTTTDTTWAQPLAQYRDMAAEFIELLRPETFIGRMTGFRMVPFLTRMPRQTSGATVGWVGQGSPKPVSKLGFDSVTIPHTKIAGIIAITEELARLSTPSAEATVRQDLVETVSQYSDQQFVNPDVAAVADVNPAAITNGSTTRISTGDSVAQITSDLNIMMTELAVQTIPSRNRYWLLHPRTENFLRTLRTSQDVFAFRDEMNQGRLLGIPFLSSSNMPLVDQGSPTASPTSLETYIVLVEASEIFLADDGEVMLDASREASLQLDSAPSAGPQSVVSLWQNNLIGIRAERYVYWKPRRTAAVYVLSQVAY
jgi:HK97 family phage major capsid protein